MPAFDLKSLSAGVLLTAIVAIVGFWIRKSTTIDVSNIDDRGKFRQDLMKQQEAQSKRIDTLDRTVALLQSRDHVFIRMFASLGAEMRMLTGYVAMHKLELGSEVLDPKELRAQVQLMADTLGRMQAVIDREERMLNLFVLEHEAQMVGEAAAQARHAIEGAAAHKRAEFDNVLGPDDPSK